MSTTKEKFLKIENVEAIPMNKSRFALGCDFEGAQYHFWVNRDTMQPEGVIYKNPPEHVKHGNPAYFRTRKMRAKSQFSESLVATLFDAMKREDLLAKMDKKVSKEEADRAYKANEEHRLERIRNASPELLTTLDEAAHECANATAADLGRLHKLAQSWAKLVSKCNGY